MYENRTNIEFTVEDNIIFLYNAMDPDTGLSIQRTSLIQSPLGNTLPAIIHRWLHYRFLFDTHWIVGEQTVAN